VKIAKLLVKHIKGVRTVEIHAEPHVNEIAGQNGAGKSSVLDSIMFALAGKRAVSTRALREGEATGEISVDLEGLVVTRRFREGRDSTLTITSADGARVGQRQLDDLWGAFTFDPLAFSRMKTVEQIGVLQQLAGEEHIAALQACDGAVTAAMEERTIVNRQLTAFGKMDAVPKAETVDVSAIAGDLKAAEEHNRKQGLAESRILSARATLEQKSERRARLAREIEALDVEIVEGTVALEALPVPTETIDTAPLHQRLAEAGATNKAAEAYRRYMDQLESQAALVARSEALDGEVASAREERERVARSVALPVPGMTMSGGGIRVNGLPFDQLCSSEQIAASARVGMASTKAALRIMLIRDGSLLDSDSFAALVGVARENDYQLWVETVGAGHGDAIVLEAGEIKDQF